MDTKFFKKNMNYILMVVGFIAIAYVFYVYNGNKQTNMFTGMTSPTTNNVFTVTPSSPLGNIEGPQATDAKTSMGGSCPKSMLLDPSELLPTDTNSKWNNMNPKGAGQLANINLLSAGFTIGENTVGNTLRNANLQIRSEPPNPQVSVGPWNQSTITPDTTRAPLEIGGSCK